MQPLTLALMLIAAGLLMLFAELLIPSGIFFVVSITAIIAGVAMTFLYSSDMYTGWLTLIGLFIIVPMLTTLLFRYWPRTPLGKRFFLSAPEEDATLASMPVFLELEDLRGRFGQAVSALRPSGIVDFNGRRVDTITEGIMVEPGQWVRCIDVKSGKVLVRPAPEPKPTDLENFDFS